MKKIALCVCTYKRVGLLTKLLESLIETRVQFLQNYHEEDFKIQIIIVDNDNQMSGKALVESFKDKFPFVNYYCEERNGLVRARNKCLKIAVEQGYSYLTFIDDDEYVDPNWLTNIYNCLIKTNSQIAFGKVQAIYPSNCPEWIIKGGFFEKSSYQNEQKNIISATANVLIDTSIVKKEKIIFNFNFNKTGGEDTYFFKEYLKKGYQSVWCQQALVYDRIIENRLNEKYIYLRAYTASYTYSEIQQMLGEENYFNSLLKGLLKALVSIIPLLFTLLSPKEKKVYNLKRLYSGLGRTKLYKISRY